jgi:hypothetical protein
VFFKYRDNYLLPPWSETAAMAAVRAINSVWEAIFFGCITYWMVGYTPTAGTGVLLPASLPSTFPCLPASDVL